MQAKTLYWLSADDMRVDDLVNIGFGDVAVPDGLGIYHDVWSVLALIEAAGLIGADSALQATLGEFLLEKFLQAGLGGGIAASAGMARRALVSAYEDVVLEFRHVKVSISNS